MSDTSKKFWRWVIDIAVIIAGSGVYALGVHCFTAPNNIAPGGVTGLATIVSFVTDLNIGMLITVMNIPLLIAGFFLLNRGTMIKTLIGVVVLSVMTDWLLKDVPVYVADSGGGILAALFGGLLMGAGLGIVYGREGTTGGTDIINKIINRFKPEIKLGQISFLVNAAVALSGYIVYKNLDVVLYAIVSVFVQSRVIDGLVYGGLEGKFLMIFSEKPQEIADRLLKLKRGVTLLSGEGAYSGENRQVVCIAVHKNEYVKVKRIVKQTDPNAFVIITGASEVLGKGFQKLD
ncbi:MAG: YitT family protein [Oscillospiraceae bacterium]|nr:YitT family protein [Oscillospiraceae bacterium]